MNTEYPEQTETYEESDAADKNPTSRPIPDGRIKGFPLRLRELIGDASLRAFGRASGISEAALRDYLRGSSYPTFDRAAALAAAGNRPVEWLMVGASSQPEGRSTPHPDTSRFALIPLYNVRFGGGKARAILDAEQVIAHLSFSRYWLKKEGLSEPDLVCANCTGDSMQGVVNDGAVMLIDTSVRRLVNGAVMALGVDGGDDDLELLVKRVERLPDGSARLLSSNPAYEPVSVQAAAIGQLNIVGRVVWTGGRVS